MTLLQFTLFSSGTGVSCKFLQTVNHWCWAIDPWSASLVVLRVTPRRLCIVLYIRRVNALNDSVSRGAMLAVSNAKCSRYCRCFRVLEIVGVLFGSGGPTSKAFLPSFLFSEFAILCGIIITHGSSRRHLLRPILCRFRRWRVEDVSRDVPSP